MNLLIFLCPLLISSCAVVHYETTSPDGNITDAILIELGRSEVITGFRATTNKEGRSVAFDSVNTDVNVDAIKAGGVAVGSVVGQALKTYTGKP